MRIVVLTALLVLAAIPLYAQQDPDDPGIQDSVIIGWAQVDSGAIFANVPLYFVTDDSIYFFNCPLRWQAPLGGVRAGRGIIYTPWYLLGWMIEETLFVDQNCINTFGYCYDTTCVPLFTNGLRYAAWTLRFIIEPGTQPQIVTIDSCTDPRNGPIVFGLWDGMTEITPAVLPGSITIGHPVGVDEPGLGPPQEFSLSQNYPNPFNPETRIEFSLLESGQATMVIYDLLGREVRRLLDTSLEPGYHAITWDGLDNYGNTVLSGMYFYRLTSSGFADTRKMLLLR